MGIKGLAQLIADISPWAIKETEIKNYFGRKVAVDASKLENSISFSNSYDFSVIFLQACVCISF